MILQSCLGKYWNDTLLEDMKRAARTAKRIHENKKSGQNGWLQLVQI